MTDDAQQAQVLRAEFKLTLSRTLNNTKIVADDQRRDRIRTAMIELTDRIDHLGVSCTGCHDARTTMPEMQRHLFDWNPAAVRRGDRTWQTRSP